MLSVESKGDFQNKTPVEVVCFELFCELVGQTEAAECGGAEERGTERGSHGRSAGGVWELAGGRALEERTGAAPGQREEDGGGHVWEADWINGERKVTIDVFSPAALSACQWLSSVCLSPL